MIDTSPQLMLITQKAATNTKTYLSFIEKCLEGGVSIVQVREKSLPDDELISFCQSLKELLDSQNIPLIINDRVDICQYVKASGVHLGQTDGCPKAAREQLGPDQIIGLSVNNISQLVAAHKQPLDYVGIGAIFNTKNKKNIEHIWGIHGLTEAMQLSKYPVIAIGGINTMNIDQIVTTSCTSVAVIGALHDAQNPLEIASLLSRTINGHYL